MLGCDDLPLIQKTALFPNAPQIIARLLQNDIPAFPEYQDRLIRGSIKP
jgi:hypothetical protein